MTGFTGRYIKWTQEQSATQGSKVELQQVLEAATKSLSSTDRYNSDVRLLRIWVQYVSGLVCHGLSKCCMWYRHFTWEAALGTAEHSCCVGGADFPTQRGSRM